MSESISQFSKNYPDLNKAFSDLKIELTKKSIEMFNQKLSVTNHTYKLIDNGDSFIIEANEVLLRTINFATFQSLNDAIETFVEEIMITDPEDDEGEQIYIDPIMLKPLERWIVETKLNTIENAEEARHVYGSVNPKTEVTKIAVRILKAGKVRKQVRLAMSSLIGRPILGSYT